MLCTSLFLKRLMRGSKWTPAHTGKDGLFRLVRLAHSIYTNEVVTRIKSYHRFVTDFVNSTQYHDENDAWSKNEHQKNYRTIAELLTNHEKIVRRYFDCGQARMPDKTGRTSSLLDGRIIWGYTILVMSFRLRKTPAISQQAQGTGF